MRPLLPWLILFFALAASGGNTPIQLETQRLRNQTGPLVVQTTYFVAPVYCELEKSGNIGSLLASLATQERAQHTVKTHLVAVVNNLASAPDSIRKENARTVEFLRQLKDGQTPVVPADAYELREGIAQYLAHPFPLHILDHTSPGLAPFDPAAVDPQPDMGKIRDLGNQYALSRIAASDLSTTLIVQADADSQLPRDAASTLQKVFSHPQYAYGLFDMDFAIERHSDPRLFQRMILDRFLVASRSQPVVGPLIVARASSMKGIGGVPHAPFGEDRQLIDRLDQFFPNQMAFLFESVVQTNYRGRIDGFGAKRFLLAQNQPWEFSEPVRQAVQRFPFVWKELKEKFPHFELLFLQEREALVERWRNEVQKTRERGKRFLTMVRDSPTLPIWPDAHRFLGSSWLPARMQEHLHKANGSLEGAWDRLVEEFPDFLQDPPSTEVRQLLGLQAMKRVLAFKKEFPFWGASLDEKGCGPALLKGR